MMTPERKAEVLEAILRAVIRKKEFSFDSFKRELGNLSKDIGASPVEVKKVLGPVFMDLVRDTFDVPSQES